MFVYLVDLLVLFKISQWLGDVWRVCVSLWSHKSLKTVCRRAKAAVKEPKNWRKTTHKYTKTRKRDSSYELSLFFGRGIRIRTSTYGVRDRTFV